MRNQIFLKSWLIIETTMTANQVNDLITVWWPNDLVTVLIIMTDRWTGDVHKAGLSVKRWDIVWVVDIDWWEIVSWPGSLKQEDIDAIVAEMTEKKLDEAGLEPRQKMTREELDKIYLDRTWKKPHHKKSNKQVRELLNSLPEDIDVEDLWADLPEVSDWK